MRNQGGQKEKQMVVWYPFGVILTVVRHGVRPKGVFVGGFVR